MIPVAQLEENQRAKSSLTSRRIEKARYERQRVDVMLTVVFTTRRFLVNPSETAMAAADRIEQRWTS